MDVAIRELDAAELDIVAGGNKAWDLAKIWTAAVGSVIGGPVLGALGATAVIGIQARSRKSLCSQLQRGQLRQLHNVGLRAQQTPKARPPRANDCLLAIDIRRRRSGSP